VKLRIKGNSIRIRLGRSEVQNLAKDGAVEQFTTFGNDNWFGYAIRASADATGVTATFIGQRIVVCAPANVIREWAATDQVGIHVLQATGYGELAIHIEKDSDCIEVSDPPSQEDEAFPRTQFAAGACAAPHN
jgi:hypothetical protein